MNKLEKVIEESTNALLAAIKKHGPMKSKHEGFAVIYEEFEELKDEVFTNEIKDPKSLKRMKKEALQVAASAMRLVLDVCD